MNLPSDPLVARLQQILLQEERTGYADKTVIGGLDRFLASWLREKRSFPVPFPSYSAQGPAERSAWAAKVLLWLGQGLSPTDPSPFAQASSPPTVSKGEAEGPKNPSSPSSGTSGRRLGRGELTPDAPLLSLPRVRRDVASRLGKLGIKTIRDVLYFFPRRHIDFSQRESIAELTPGPEQTAVGFVWQAREVRLGPRRRGAEVVIGDETGNIRAVWFNQPYLVRLFRPQAQVIFSGRVTVFRGQKVFESPEYELLDASDQELVHTGRLVPVYPLTEGLSGRTVRRLVKQMVDTWAPRLPDPLPGPLRERYHFFALSQALQSAHYPASLEAQAEARRRLAFDELFTMQLGALRKRQEWQGAPGYSIPVDPEVLAGFKACLPFQLTAAQERVLQELARDLAQPKPMSRLLQGEVGSGKTVVAAAVLLLAVAAGYQGALMAPTEILAEQHYRNLSRLYGHPEFEALETLLLPFLVPQQKGMEELGRPMRMGLLTGSSRPTEKQWLREAAASGELDILVGTHALIQEGVIFQDLALAVIDEQHRFGVAQRAALRQKGGNPHILVMSATPIPRTLALTLYGDLESSVLDELPPGRQPVDTILLEPHQRAEAYQFLRAQVQGGRQAFIICPLIEESPVVEARAAIAEHRRLSREVFPDLRLGLLHGRMTPGEKDQVMERFREGDLDILVSTSVVEVGIDVPNATVMLIEGADRFGLSQLHQFRGRVGRGQHQSSCLLLSDSPSAEARERLAILARTSDGFKLAEEDLRLRGPGEFFGTRQSGLPELRMARLDDWELLEAARTETLQLLAQDPELALPEHQDLREAVAYLRPLGQTDLS